MTEVNVNGLKINSEKAKEEFQARYEMQEKHLEETYGKVRELELQRAETFNNHAVVNWIFTLHDFSGKVGMDYANHLNSLFSVHLNGLEEKVRIMQKELGDEKLKELGIDPFFLYPSEVATRGLLEVQKAARLRARAGKYIKQGKQKPSGIIS